MTTADRIASAPPAAGHPLLWLAAWLVLTVYLLTPPTEVMTPTLDSSNYGSYAWQTSRGLQHGKEVIAMTGPLGFLAYGTTYGGELFTAHRLGDILLKAVFAGLALLLAAQSRGLRRWSWVVCILLFLPNVDDLFYDFTLLCAGLWLLKGTARPRLDPGAMLAAALLGFMALMKGTNVFVAGLTLAAVVGQGLLVRRPGRALAVVLLAGVTFLAGWLLAGQRAAHLPAYFRGVWELATGYNEAMGLASGRRELVTGLLLVAGLSGLFALAAWRWRREPASLLVIAFLAGFTFLKWKHGFLRADGHVFIFFNYALLALAAFWLVAPRDWQGPARPVFVLTTLALAGLGVAAAAEFRWGRLARLPADAPPAFRHNLIWLASPGSVREARERELTAQRQAADLPQIRMEIEDATVDFFGYEQGVLLLNGFNYRPRPMGGGSFNVFTPYLQRKNEAFLRHPQRRPAFQLVKIQTLDGRLPTADDPLTLNALLHLYEPVRAQRDYLLFRQRPDASAPAPQSLGTVRVRAGEPVAVPAVADDDLLLFSLEARYSFAGRVQGTLYRPPRLEIQLQTHDDAEPRTFRVSPAMARVPVLLSPLVESNEDLLGLYGAGVPRRVTQLTLRPAPGYADEFELTFHRLPRPPAPPDGLAAELLACLQHPLANRPPLEVTPDSTGIRELHGEPITLVHAPGHLTLPLQAGDQRVSFQFGLMPQAHDPGRTKGVEFLVELVDDDERVTVLYSRYLDPVARPADRGMQWARVFLPPVAAGARLRLRTAPGPTGDAAWAQSYFARIQIMPGPPDPRQFAGFSVEPLPPGFTGHAEHDAYGRRVRAFHPPSRFVFPIPEAATRVAVAAGLQAVAYEGENRSDGIEVLVSLEPEGEPARPLARWRLDPLNHVRDRGTHAWVLELPSSRPAGSRLVVEAGPGPAQDDRWDWAYLQTVHFR